MDEDLPIGLMALPAGILPYDNRIEIYACPVNEDHAYYMTAGGSMRISLAPEQIKKIIYNDMVSHPDKDYRLQQEGYTELDERLEKYARCMSGALDRDADIVDGSFINIEYWSCPSRSICRMQICNPLLVGPNNEPLTNKEADHLALISKGLYNKEIADRLNISPETVKVHHKHLYKKTGLYNKAELTLLSLKKNLIS